MEIVDEWEFSQVPAAQFPAGSRASQDAGELQARQWVSLLTGDAAITESSIESVQESFTRWLSASSEDFYRNLSGIPETFRTTRFFSKIKNIEGPLKILKTVQDSLGSGACSFFEAIDHVGHGFGWEEARLLKWKQELDNFSGLVRWLPAFTHAHEYLHASFALGRETLDRSRESLLQAIGDPHRFLDPEARKVFDARFADFKKGYIDAYFLMHEDALHVMSGLQKDELKIDKDALRNLDLLSGLQYTDKSYLNRVKLLAKWIQRNQCNLPVNQILESYPRCYCNFNPSGRRQPMDTATRINSTIQEGLEYFRSVLRRCANLVRQGLNDQAPEESTLKQISAILEDGPMVPLKPEAIKVLNKIIAGNAAEFQAELRRTHLK